MASRQILTVSSAAFFAKSAVVTPASAAKPAAAETAVAKGLNAETAAIGTPAAAEEKDRRLEEMKAKWPGWPGYSVFRLVVPVVKVGGIIGRKGDLIRKLVEETRARVRVLDGPVNSPDRIVLISGKEEPEAALPPAMDAVLRIFKRVNGLPENDADGKAADAAGAAFCSIRLLVASSQAISLIGKQGSSIKFIQECSGASVRVLSKADELPFYASSDERVVELQGEALKVLKAFEAVVNHLRKFLVDHSVLPLFEKAVSYSPPSTQERQVDTWSERTLIHAPHTSLGADYPVPTMRDSLYFDRERHIESHITPSRLSFYEGEYGFGNRSSTIGHPGGPLVTRIARIIQIPLARAEDLIGVRGANIDYIRRNSGAILIVQECRGRHDEITVEIKGTSSQVQEAQQLIHEFTSGHRGTLRGNYGNLDSGLRSPYSQLGSSSYSLSSSFAERAYGDGYGPSSGLGGYSSYRF